jgi:hypothetical protein
MRERMAAEPALPGLLAAARWRLEASGGESVGVLADAGFRLRFLLASRDRVSDGLGTALRWLGLVLGPGRADREWVRLPEGLGFLYVLLRPVRVLLHGPARRR